MTVTLCKTLSDHLKVERLIREWSRCYETSYGVEMRMGELSKKSLERMRQIESELGTDCKGIWDYFRVL